MYIWHANQVRRPRDNRWAAAGVAALALALLLLTIVLLEGCCQSYLRRDDTAPPSQRYYLVRECSWSKPAVLCTSPTRLPADTTEGSCP